MLCHPGDYWHGRRFTGPTITRWGFPKEQALSALHAQRRAAGDAERPGRRATGHQPEPHDGRRPFASSYDLDTIDWLAPGGLVLAYECDVVWLDDEP